MDNDQQQHARRAQHAEDAEGQRRWESEAYADWQAREAGNG